MGQQQWKIRAAQEVDVDGLFLIVAEFATSFVPQRTAFHFQPTWPSGALAAPPRREDEQMIVDIWCP